MTDFMSEVISSWSRVRPELELGPVAVVARILRAAQLLQTHLDATAAASGDLSHRTRPGAPSGFDPRGAEFDRRFRAGLEHGDLAPLDRLLFTFAAYNAGPAHVIRARRRASSSWSSSVTTARSHTSIYRT